MRADLGVPLHTGAPVVQTTHTVHTVQVKDVKVDEHHHEETDFYYTKERISYINLIKNLGILAVLVSIASIVLASIHVAKYPLDFAVILLVAACVFFIASILTVYWAIKASKAFKAHSDLFQPQLNEGLSRTVFIVGLLVAAISAFIVTHLYVEFTYSADYTVAQDLGNKDNLNEYFRIHFIIQSVFAGFFFFFFLLASRAAFNCLKFGNQAMSQLVFLGSFLLLGFALATIFSANQAFPYNDDPALRQLFPVWNIRGLLITSIALAALSVTAFMVDHRSWRVGFFVLAFLLLVSLVLLASFTGYAYRNTRNTYNAIKGDSCSLRMDLVRDTELQDYGCPNKYVTATAPNQCPLVTEWENNANPPVTACLNQNCCGLLGQLYSKHLIQLSAFGLLTTLAAALVSIGCYYFWYVTWVDTARDKRRDFVWLALMGLLILVFIILNFTLEIPRVDQRTWSY